MYKGLDLETISHEYGNNGMPCCWLDLDSADKLRIYEISRRVKKSLGIGGLLLETSND